MPQLPCDPSSDEVSSLLGDVDGDRIILFEDHVLIFRLLDLLSDRINRADLRLPAPDELLEVRAWVGELRLALKVVALLQPVPVDGGLVDDFYVILRL